MIIIANILDPDQARQKVRPDLDPKLFDTLMVFLKEFFKEVDFEKNQQTTKKPEKLPSRQRVNPIETPFNAFANKADPDQTALV